MSRGHPYFSTDPFEVTHDPSGADWTVWAMSGSDDKRKVWSVDGKKPRRFWRRSKNWVLRVYPGSVRRGFENPPEAVHHEVLDYRTFAVQRGQQLLDAIEDGTWRPGSTPPSDKKPPLHPERRLPFR